MTGSGCRGGWAALAGLAMLLAVSGGCRRAVPPHRNLVIVLVDTLRSDHLPSYGYERQTAPTLAALAAAGTQLQGYAVSSWTKPSVATLLTGLAPQRHQAQRRSDALPAAAPYLPEILAGRGWTTAAVFANPNSGPEVGFGRGFATVRNLETPGKVDGRLVTTAALELRPELRPPYFLWVHYVDPHDPYRPVRPWSDDGDGAAGGEAARRYIQPRGGQRQRLLRPHNLARLRDQYDGEIAEVDREIGRLLAGLRQRGLLRDTLVVVTSDHGEEFGDHGAFLHGRTLYQEVLEVPLIFWSGSARLLSRPAPGRGPHPAPRAEHGAAPAAAPGRAGSRPFHQLDFLPTMLAALGVPVPPGLDGEPRWAALQRGGPTAAEELHFHLDMDRRAGLAVIRPPHKAVWWNGRPPVLLFDLATDPRESSSLGEGQPEILENLLRTTFLYHNRLAAAALDREAITPDGDLARRLAALGYLGGAGGGGRDPRLLPPLLDAEALAVSVGRR